MYQYSTSSLARLTTCDSDLVDVFMRVIDYWDCTIIEGRRTKERQDYLYSIEQSQVQWPNSKHNVTAPRALSRAVDAGPYYPGEGIPWDDWERFRAFGGFVLGVGAGMGIRLRWGGDWDGDRYFTDQKFHDLPHFELL